MITIPQGIEYTVALPDFTVLSQKKQNVSKQTQLHLLPGEIFYMTQRLELRTIKNKMLNFVREIQKKG